MQYFPIAINVLHIHKESKIPRHFLKMKSISFTSKVLSDFHWFRVSKLRKMVEKKLCRFSKNFEREIRAISLNEWQTPDSTLMRRRRKGFLRSLLIIMEEFFSSQVAQLINGKNPRESWHFWPKMDLFSERIFMTVNLLKLNVRESKKFLLMENKCFSQWEILILHRTNGLQFSKP